MEELEKLDFSNMSGAEILMELRKIAEQRNKIGYALYEQKLEYQIFKMVTKDFTGDIIFETIEKCTKKLIEEANKNALNEALEKESK